LAASGDQGAPGDDNYSCSSDELSTIFPGASPYVTSVGATMLVLPPIPKNITFPPACSPSQGNQCSNNTNETVCSFPDALITSGGGFSVYSPVPAWQKAAVNQYFSSGVKLPPQQYWNRTNRGFPDVAANGHNYLIYLGGQWNGVDGTSCSTPVFAGMVALLNDWRFNNNKAPLGFITPLLYQAWAADSTIFRDIAYGNNTCTESCCIPDGFFAAKGWDPITGLGVPNFTALLNYIKKLK